MSLFKSNLAEHKRLAKMDWLSITRERIEARRFTERISQIKVPIRPMMELPECLNDLCLRVKEAK